jgi:hypothetical protein
VGERAFMIWMFLMILRNRQEIVQNGFVSFNLKEGISLQKKDHQSDDLLFMFFCVTALADEWAMHAEGNMRY